MSVSMAMTAIQITGVSINAVKPLNRALNISFQVNGKEVGTVLLPKKGGEHPLLTPLNLEPGSDLTVRVEEVRRVRDNKHVVSLSPSWETIRQEQVAGSVDDQFKKFRIRLSKLEKDLWLNFRELSSTPQSILHTQDQVLDPLKVAINDVILKITEMRPFIDRIGRGKPLLDAVMKFGLAVSEVDPRAKAVASGLTVIYQMMKDQNKGHGEIMAVANSMEKSVDHVRSIEKIVELKHVKETLEAFSGLMQDTVNLIKAYVEQNPFTNFFFTTSNNEKIDALKGRHASFLEEFDRGVKVDEAVKVGYLANEGEIKELEKYLAEGVKTVKPTAERCIDGTREEILAQINSRTDNLDGPNIIWVHGAPGSGKSSTSLSTKYRLHEEGRLVTYFRFDRNQTSTTTVALWQHVALCLAHILPSVHKHLLQHARTNNRVDLDSKYIFGRLIKEPLSKLTEPTADLPLVIVIDGLDECGGAKGHTSPDRQELLQTLQQWSELPIHIRIKLLVTSREEGDIHDVLSKISKNASIHIPSGSDLTDNPTSLLSTSASKDIHTFLKRRLSQIAERKGLNPDWPSDMRITEMTQRAAGNFMWVVTATNMVESSLDPDEGLKLIMGPMSELDGMKPLYSLYSTILETFLKTISTSDAETVRIVLGTMIYAKRPLSDEEYVKLPTSKPIKSVTVRSIRRGLGSVLVSDSDLRFVHKSFDDFLLSIYCPKEFAIDEEDIHYRLVRLCISTMVSNDSGLRFNICKLETSFLKNVGVPGIETKVESGISRLLSYSCCFWTDHLSCIPYDDKLQVEVGEMLQHKLLYWFEAMSLLQEIDRISHALLSVLNWSESSGDKDFKDFIHDARRFICAFIHPITQSAPHIYISALPFAPKNSLVAKRFCPQFPRVLSLSVGQQTNWPSYLFTSEHHKNPITSVAFSPDNKFIISGSSDKTVCLRDAETGDLIAPPFRTSSMVCSTFFSSDGRRVWANCYNGQVFGWDVAKGDQYRTFMTDNCYKDSSCFLSSDGNIVSVSNDQGRVMLWSAETGAQLRRASNLPVNSSWPRRFLVACSPHGDYLAYANYSGMTIGLRNLVDGSEIKCRIDVGGHTKRMMISAISFAVDGFYVVTGSADGLIMVWDAETAEPVDKPLATGNGQVDAVAYSHVNKLIVLATGVPGTVEVWNASTRQEILGPLEGHTSRIRTIALSRDGRRVLSGSNDGTVRMWDLDRTAALRSNLTADGSTNQVLCIKFSPCGKRFVSVELGGILRVLDTTTSEELSRFEGHPRVTFFNSGVKIIFFPDGSQIVGDSDRCLCIWDVDSGELVFSMGHDSSGLGIQHLAFRWTDCRLITCSDYGVRAWRLENGSVTEDTSILSPEPANSDKPVEILALSPDGLTVLAYDRSRTTRHYYLWNTIRGHSLPLHFSISRRRDHIHTAAFSPGGSVLVTISRDWILRIWDTQTRKLTNSHPVPGLSSLTFSPDNRHIAYFISSRTPIYIYDACTGHPVATPWKSHTANISALAFSPDGKKLASAAVDGQIRIWDTSGLIGGSEPSVGFLGVGASIKDGWVMDSEGRLLFWVPIDHRGRLVWPLNVAVIGGAGIPTKLDLGKFRFGNIWEECYEGLVGAS